MVAINRLTGHSRGFFSVFTLPPNQVTSSERQRKNNERRNQQPEYRDVADLIRRETRSLDIVNYRADNWMRCWFAGIDPDRVGITQTGKLEAWKGLVRETLDNVAAISACGSVFAFEVGEIRNGSLLLDRVVTDVARETVWEPICVLVNEQMFTKTSNTWGIDNNRGGTNSNRIVVMRRR